jgi:ribonuclease PH
LLFRADGSSRLSSGNTMVLAGVFGPASGRSKSGDGGVLSIEVVLGNNSPTASTDKTVSYKSTVADVLRAAVRVEEYPRCTLVVALRIQRDDGGLLAALVNAACAAVMDAGVEMNCLPVAASFAWVPPHPVLMDGNEGGAEGELLVDPNASEEAAHTSLTVVCTAAAGGPNGTVLAVHASGDMLPTTVPRCFEAAGAVARTFTEISRRKAEIPSR